MASTPQDQHGVALSRREFLRLTGGIALAAGTQAWRPPAALARTASVSGALKQFDPPALIQDLATVLG